MIILEIIETYIIEVIFDGIILGTLSRINNAILKLRGIETKSVEELKLERIRKRYEYKFVKLKKKVDGLDQGLIGLVLEVVDKDYCLVEFETKDQEIRKLKLKELLLSKKIKPTS